MVEIKNIEVFGLEKAVKMSGYPMITGEPSTTITDKDFIRAKKLAFTPVGSGHNNFLKGITVMFDIKYPQYFTPQLQRYHFLDIVSSSSKMQKITKADIFSSCNQYVNKSILNTVNEYIQMYNKCSKDAVIYNMIDDCQDTKYILFMKIISNLPMGYEMWMGVTTNYLQLKTIYNQRKNHKLIEDWGAFCDMIKKLPYAEFIIGE